MKKAILLVGVIALMCSLTLCKKESSSSEKEIDYPKHIVMIGFDGLSADCIHQGAEMPTLRKLFNEGAYTLENRSVLPSSSACNWASMFMGAGTELHGYTDWGSKVPEVEPREKNQYGMFPGIFGLIRDAYPDAETGLFFEWGGIKYVVDTLAISHYAHTRTSEVFPDGCLTPALDYIKDKKPQFCTIIFDQPDGAGHAHGWDSEEYYENVALMDSYLAKLLEGLEEAGIADETVLILVSDHGGNGTKHGGKTLKEMQTPLVFYGKGIKEGFYIPESIMVYDVASTIAYLMKIEQPQVWTGRPVKSVFK